MKKPEYHSQLEDCIQHSLYLLSQIMSNWRQALMSRHTLSHCSRFTRSVSRIESTQSSKLSECRLMALDIYIVRRACY